MGCILHESDTDVAECLRELASERHIAGVIRSLINGKVLQFECGNMLHEALLMPVLLYGSETVIWRERERSRIRAVRMGNFTGLLEIRRMDIAPNVQIKVLCRVAKGMHEMIDESFLYCFGHID